MSKMLCSDKFDRIFLYCQRGYILISIMTKFGRASLKDGQVITRCHENVTKLWRQCSFIKLFLLDPWLDWLVPLTNGHNSEPAIRVRVLTWPNSWLIYFSGTARKIKSIIKYVIFSMILSCCVVFKSLVLHNSVYDRYFWSAKKHVLSISLYWQTI